MTGVTIRLFNTLTRQKEPLEPIEPGKLAMYHCGPTVYSSPHIGNFRSFLLADLMRRFFEDQGFAVHQVMNAAEQIPAAFAAESTLWTLGVPVVDTDAGATLGAPSASSRRGT